MDMPSDLDRRIFDDKRRGGRSKSPDPPFNSYGGTGPLFARAASRMSCVGPATRRHPLLPPVWWNGAQSGSRHDRSLNLNRP